MSNGGMPPIDPNVKIPRGVVEASAKSDAIHAAAYQTTPEGGTEQPTNLEATKPTPTNPNPPAPAPAPPAVVPPPVQTQPQPQPDQRYASLKGRFDQQSGELANTRARLASLESLVATLQAAPPRAPEPPPPPKAKRVTDEEVKEYGDDMIKMVHKAALDAVEPIIEQRVSAVRAEYQTDLRKIDTKVKGAEAETAISAHQRLLDNLDRAEPQWRVVNRHPEFHSWLALTDPLSGAIRKNLLNDAVKRVDANRALAFYRQFLAEKGVPAPANGGQSSQPPPSNGNGATRIDLAALAAPGRPAASGGTPAVPENKPIITRAQISAFYSNKMKGVYPPDEAAAHEKMIFEATKEGRVR